MEGCRGTRGGFPNPRGCPMLFLALIGVLVGVWLLAVLCLAHYFRTPQALFGLAEAVWKWLTD